MEEVAQCLFFFKGKLMGIAVPEQKSSLEDLRKPKPKPLHSGVGFSSAKPKPLHSGVGERERERERL
jgi:hypothetical protein